MTTRQGLLQLFVGIVAIAGFCMGVGGYIAYARLGDVAGQPVFVSPYFATVIIACSFGLSAALVHSRYARFWALAVICAVGLARMAPQWSDAWLHGRTVSVNFATILILLGATAALFLSRGVSRKERHTQRNALAVALLGVSVSTLISLALIEDNILTRQKSAQRSAKAVATDLHDRISRAETLMRRLSERWSVMEHIPTHAFIEQEFHSYMRDFPFFLSLAVLDENGLVVSERSREQRSVGWIKGLTADRGLRDWLKHVGATGQTRVTVLSQARSDGKVGLAVSPLLNSGGENGFVAAGIDVAGIVAWAMSRSDGGYFRISHEDDVLYQSAGEPPAQAYAAGDIRIPVHDDFTLRLSYIYATTSDGLVTEVWAEFVLLAGMVFTFFLILSQRLTFVARQRAIQLSHNALHDPLTGLPNRRMLEQKLQEAHARARRKKQPVSVVFFDLDGIKLINDSIGHDVGDDVLREAAKRLQRSVQDGGRVSHLGAYEFVLVFFGIDPSQIEERTQHTIGDLAKPYNIGGRILSMAANAGIATSNGNVGDAMELVRQADLAMLRAKQEGRNTWHTYTADLSVRMAERLELRNDLQGALEADALQLHYQPIVEGHSGRIIGVEALLRWQHPAHGYISPSRFIPLAEETGQIVALTQWTLATACRDSGTLRKHGFPSFPVIINISPLCFQRADFVERIERALHDAKLPAEFLELEITEGVLLDNEKAAILKLKQFREMGVRTSIDDFGTGYSSLSYLKNLPIDKVKIDRSFVVDVVSDPADAAIVQGIISMAHHLGLKVIAEGVETEAQFAFLLRNRCDEFQGYLFARPMPLDVLVTTLTGNRCQLFPDKPLNELVPERVLLLVDDEKNILNALTRLLRRDGYRILTAGSPAQAFDLLAQHDIHVIVSDQRMPDMNGTEFFSKVKDMYPDTVRIILSGYTDLKSVTEAINHGAIYKFITKPWDDEELRKEIGNAFK